MRALVRVFSLVRFIRGSLLASASLPCRGAKSCCVYLGPFCAWWPRAFVDPIQSLMFILADRRNLVKLRRSPHCLLVRGRGLSYPLSWPGVCCSCVSTGKIPMFARYVLKLSSSGKGIFVSPSQEEDASSWELRYLEFRAVSPAFPRRERRAI